MERPLVGFPSHTVALAFASAVAGCADDKPQLFNVLEPPPPVAEVPCPGADAASPWIAVPAPVDTGLGAIWGASARDVWAVGASGAILHFDGAAWSDASPVSPRIAADLLAIRGLSPRNVWAVGRDGLAAHFDGDVWSIVPTDSQEPWIGVWPFAPDDVWIAGAAGIRRWNGAAFAELGPKAAVTALWASGPNNVYLVTNKEIIHFDGREFSVQTIRSSDQLNAVWGTDPEHVWTIGFSTTRRPGFGAVDKDGHWTFEAAPPRAFYFALWSNDSRELWAGANVASIFHNSQGKWCREYIMMAEGAAVTGFWGATHADVWAVGARRDAMRQTRSVLLRRKAAS